MSCNTLTIYFCKTITSLVYLMIELIYVLILTLGMSIALHNAPHIILY